VCVCMGGGGGVVLWIGIPGTCDAILSGVKGIPLHSLHDLGTIDIIVCEVFDSDCSHVLLF